MAKRAPAKKPKAAAKVEARPIGELDLNNPEERERLLLMHPCNTRQYRVATPMIESTYQLVRERVIRRRTGSVLKGDTRMGKSECALAIKELLELEFPSCYCIYLSADRNTSGRQASFDYDLLSACGVIAKPRETHTVMAERFLVHIHTQLQRRKGSQVVLIIDEMQLLQEPEFYQLLVAGNRLAARGVFMTVVGFAQLDIDSLITAFYSSHKRNLIARFLAEPIGFPGCSNSSELAQILDSYDHEKFFPEGSGWTYTRFFLPLAYAAGLRVKMYAEPLWAALDKAVGGSGEGPVYMDYLARTIEDLLVGARLSDAPTFQFQQEHIDRAVRDSGLQGFCNILETGQDEAGQPRAA